MYVAQLNKQLMLNKKQEEILLAEVGMFWVLHMHVQYQE